MTRPGLLVSVRSAAEAKAALVGGADLIDVKEPARGPLGRADDRTILEVLDAVGGERPVSAALGEWREYCRAPILADLAFVKWGLTGCGLSATEAVRQATERPQPVLVAYADFERADSPDPFELAGVAGKLAFPVFLIDTAVKDGSTLLDWISLAMLARMLTDLRNTGVRVALAGSLTATEIRSLLPLNPDWFAVRGAACVGGREGAICPDRVHELRALIAPAG